MEDCREITPPFFFKSKVFINFGFAEITPARQKKKLVSLFCSRLFFVTLQQIWERLL